MTFENIQPGEYTLQETKAPEGYYINPSVEDVTIPIVTKKADKLIEVEKTNDPFAAINITKIDNETGVSLPGAKFKVVNAENENEVFIEEIVSDEEGKLLIVGLPAGKYHLIETEAPKGYKKNGNPMELTVHKNEEDSTTDKQEINFENDIFKGSLKITKVDTSNENAPLEDATFSIEATELKEADEDFLGTYNSSLAEETYNSDADGKIEVSDLRPGRYILKEIDVPSGYQETHIKNKEIEFSIGLDEDGNLFAIDDSDIENKEITVPNYQKIDIKVEKVWKDDNNATEKRPENIKVQLYQNNELHRDAIELNQDNKWSHNFEGLDFVDSNGDEYTYTIDEVDDNGNPYVPSGYEKSINGFTITNTRSENITISGEKTWVYGKGGAQYTPDKITVTLFKGTGEDRKEVTSQEVEADSDGDWKYEFTDQPRFDENGVEIEYFIQEEDVAGFTSTVDDFNITNKQIVTEVSVTKVWEEEDSQYRPEEVTIQLKNGNEVVASHDLKGDTTDAEWTYTFTDLPKFDKVGKEIEYTVDEVEPAGYEKSIAENEITNKQKTAEVKVTKVWNEVDSDYRPDSIEFILKADGETVTNQTAEVVKQDNRWTYTFKNLPTHNQDGKEIIYSAEEVNVPAGYESKISEGNPLEITNTQSTKDVDVKKIWSEVDNQYRPDEIKLILSNARNDKTVEHTLNGGSDEEEWADTFKNLPTHDVNGNEITYTVDEEDLTGYTKKISEDGLTITNTQKTINISGTKTWKDNNDTSARPKDGITVQVMKRNADNTLTEVTSKTVKANTEDKWEYIFENLPKYDKNGNEIEYVINELNVPGYEAEIEDYNITNTRTAKTNISVTKKWLDEDENDRPESVTVQLYQNGEEYEDEVTFTANDKWTYTF